MVAQIEEIAEQIFNGIINNHDLADMMKNDLISKNERRKVLKHLDKLKKVSTLTPRQKLRLAAKEKKSQPKLTKEERLKRFTKDVEFERERNEANFTICLGCRKRGHFLKDCPKLPVAAKAVNNIKTNENVREMCFNCGSKEHTLKSCLEPKIRNTFTNKILLKYANCFICKQDGHIARDCQENANGLYPMGGCCHICLQKTHLARDCPDRTEEDVEKQKLLRLQAEEDKALGVRIQGLKTTNTVTNDDFIDDINDNEVESVDSDNVAKKKKSKRKGFGGDVKSKKKSKV
eukprot:gene16253-22132_t